MTSKDLFLEENGSHRSIHEIESISTNDSNQVIRKLHKMFAAHGIPKIMVSDNGPPFHSDALETFLGGLGIKHEFSTAYWPQGNAEAERFMRTLGKIITIANMQGSDLESVLYKFLFQYRTTPHSTTKVAPAELLFNSNINGKIPSVAAGIVNKHQYAKENEEASKGYQNKYADQNRNCKPQNIHVGDLVLIKQKRRNKSISRYNPNPFRVIKVSESDVKIRTTDGKELCRKKSFFKKLPRATNEYDPVETEDKTSAFPEGLKENKDETETRRSNRTRQPPDRSVNQYPRILLATFREKRVI